MEINRSARAQAEGPAAENPKAQTAQSDKFNRETERRSFSEARNRRPDWLRG